MQLYTIYTYNRFITSSFRLDSVQDINRLTLKVKVLHIDKIYDLKIFVYLIADYINISNNCKIELPKRRNKWLA